MARAPKQETSDSAITRPLRNFEVDRYWAKVAAQAVQHSWLAVFDKFSWQRLIVPAIVTIIASGIQFYVLGWASTIDNLKILATSILAGLCDAASIDFASTALLTWQPRVTAPPKDMH
jgi:hypothetical protein